jgi:hypothetical protein
MGERKNYVFSFKAFSFSKRKAELFFTRSSPLGIEKRIKDRQSLSFILPQREKQSFSRKEKQSFSLRDGKEKQSFSRKEKQSFSLQEHLSIFYPFFNPQRKFQKKLFLEFFSDDFSLQYSPIFHKGSSETIRQLSNIVKDKEAFSSWLAGIIDGDGNFDIRKNSNKTLVLKAIRIKLHNRDIRILTRIQNMLHVGRIRSDKSKPYSIYIISTKKEMAFVVNMINGLIRLKVDSFKKACNCLNIEYIESNYILQPLDPYFAGLIDTDGSIVFNYSSNRIECNLELKHNAYSEKLNFDKVIPNYKPTILFRKKKNNTPGSQFKSVAIKYQTVSGMLHLYSYFMKNRLYSDFKFYRISKIKQFLQIRSYAKYPANSAEFKVYSFFVLKWIQYQNPLWTKVPFVQKLTKP